MLRAHVSEALFTVFEKTKQKIMLMKQLFCFKHRWRIVELKNNIKSQNSTTVVVPGIISKALKKYRNTTQVKG